ncbi:MAG: winged helix-turn-helix domain-containing protein [Pseudomonadota bacterium]
MSDAMTNLPVTAPFRLGSWTVDLASGTLTNPEGGSERMEPKVSDLLRILIEAEGHVVSRDALFERLWPGTIVGEDTLSRTVFKLRKALGDAPKSPTFVETVPKRGYRLLQAPQPLQQSVPPRRMRLAAIAASAVLIGGVAGMLIVTNRGNVAAPSAAITAAPITDIERATARYMHFTRADNEAAIELYQRVLSGPAPDPRAQAGLAGALVQRVVRWPRAIGIDADGATSIEEALRRGLVDRAAAKDVLAQASQLAEAATRRAPDYVDGWRIVGLVRSAQRDIDGAMAAYREALKRDPDNWAVQINVSELQHIEGNTEQSYATLSSAYDAMRSVSGAERDRALPWRAGIGLIIAEKDLDAGRLDAAERWYRRILRDEPFHEETTQKLAALLEQTGREEEGRTLCATHEERTGALLACATD